MTDRLQKLLDMLKKQPADAFVLYGIALEHKKTADFPQALEFLDRTLSVDPAYCYAYFQKGQILEETGHTDQAKLAYHEGITAASAKGDTHAKSELEGALMMLEEQTPMVDGLKHYLKNPEWRKQLKWRRLLWSAMVRMGLTGVYALPLNRRWVDIHRRPMPMTNLDPAYVGLKIVQISDLHYSPVVWQKYLIQYLHWVNDLQPDLVVVTGDLITGGYRYAHRIATILTHLKPPLGVICTFGNHDYSFYGKNHVREGNRRGDYLEKCLKDRGHIVLRNEVKEIWRPGAQRPLVVVGLDDEWSGHIDPVKAFANVNPDDAILCLNHNPVNVLELMQYPWQWMLAGHTHGRQVATSKIGQALYPKRYRHYTHGYYPLQGRHLYVNRGLSYGQRVLHWCRPEITSFRLTQV